MLAQEPWSAGCQQEDGAEGGLWGERRGRRVRLQAGTVGWSLMFLFTMRQDVEGMGKDSWPLSTAKTEKM